MVARIIAIKGAATIANSSAAAPSWRRAKPVAAGNRLRIRARLFLSIACMTEELQFVRSVLRCSKQALRKCCGRRTGNQVKIDALPTIGESTKSTRQELFRALRGHGERAVNAS